ncbi:MAG TPA: GNAT family N-acetyltransferase [Polyangiaceae bacterium]|nr:GNAT family N-acetyltransferase [Polyangiaceae bacterium]
MAALTQPAGVRVRAAAVGEGAAIASLWRDLWDAHEAWGGYPGSRDPRVYAQLARRLDDDARVRAGHPILGRHVHLVCEVGGIVCGQVEGWFEQHGVDASTPFTCEVRSLVVAERFRTIGAGRALLDALASAAGKLSGAAQCVLAAEVLERNPAHAFYRRVGYSPVAWSARIEAAVGAARSDPPSPFAARLAGPRDALALARLESMLAARRQACGDARFDRPRTLDATSVAAIGAQLAIASPASQREPATLVAVDRAGNVRGAASFTVHSLEPPFVPMRRALVGRFALDVACPPGPLVAPLVARACELGLAQGAMHVELTDLSPPGTALHDAALATGADGWSCVVTKIA